MTEEAEQQLARAFDQYDQLHRFYLDLRCEVEQLVGGPELYAQDHEA